MKQYYKEENGIKIYLGNILKIGDKQIINPTEEQILEAGYVLETNELTDQQLLENIKRGKILRLNAYDSSQAVNSCYIVHNNNKLEYWADRYERDSLKSALNDCISLGRETYRLDLRNLGVSLNIKCSDLLQMLAQLELYAIDCYNKTTDHEFAINACTTQEEVLAYDYEVGYPEKLTFNI